MITFKIIVGTSEKMKNKNIYGLWSLLLISIFIVLIIYPLLTMFRESFFESKTMTFTLNNFKRLFNPRYLKVVWNTLYISFLTTMASIGIGIPLSLFIWKQNFWGKNTLVSLLVVPFMVPSYILVLFVMVSFSRNGVINVIMRRLLNNPEYIFPINLMFNIKGILAILMVHNLVLVIYMMLSFLSSINPSYEEAAVSLGATPLTAIRRVILPIMNPVILGSGMLIVARAMSDYVVILLIGGKRYATLSVEVVSQTFGYLDINFASVLAIAVSTMTIIIMYSYILMYRKRKLVQ